MSQEDRREEPLLKAIQELRSELLGWIDDRLQSLRLRENQSRVEAPLEPANAARPLRESSPINSLARGMVESAEPTDGAASGDARKRLNDLARQLGERLRHPESPRGGVNPSSRTAAPGGEGGGKSGR